MGVSFAIPIEVALDVVEAAEERGQGDARPPRHRHAAGDEGARALVPAGRRPARSSPMSSRGPGGQGRARVGDVVLEWNGEKIEDPNELPRLVAATKPGDKATLEVWRNGKAERLAVNVGEFPAEAKAAARAAPAKEAHDTLGLAVSELPPEGRKALGIDYGLVIEEVRGGAAAGSGLERGDVIVAVGQDRFRSLEEFNKLLAAQGPAGAAPSAARRERAVCSGGTHLRLSVHREPAGNAQHLAGDELGVVARKKQHCARDVLGLAEAPDRHGAAIGFAQLVGIACALHELLQHAGLGEPGHTTLRRTPLPANSRASVLVSAMSPPLHAE